MCIHTYKKLNFLGFEWVVANPSPEVAPPLRADINRKNSGNI